MGEGRAGRLWASVWKWSGQVEEGRMDAWVWGNGAWAPLGMFI